MIRPGHRHCRPPVVVSFAVRLVDQILIVAITNDCSVGQCLSRIPLSAEFAFAISAQCARGIY